MKVTEEYNFQQETDLTGDTKVEPSLVSPEAAVQAVEVQVEKIAERQREITAKIEIPHPVEQVWQVLTDYEGLVDFIPNLSKSSRLEHPTGGIRVEQVGTQRLLRFNFSARVVLDLEENYPHEINFQMVEGDFKDFSGRWRLEPYSLDHQTGTYLCYTVRVWPKRSMPVAILENRLVNDVRLNVLAICQRLEELAS